MYIKYLKYYIMYLSVSVYPFICWSLEKNRWVPTVSAVLDTANPADHDPKDCSVSHTEFIRDQLLHYEKFIFTTTLQLNMYLLA